MNLENNGLRVDRGQALSFVQLVLAGLALAVATFMTAANGFWGMQDPLAPMALLASAAMVALHFGTRMLPFTTRLNVHQTVATIVIFGYLAWRFIIGNPLDTVAWILVMALGPAALGTLRDALIWAGSCAAGAFISVMTGFVANAPDLTATMVSIAFAAAIAYILSKERDVVAQQHEQITGARETLESVMRSIQDATFHISTDGAVKFANAAARDWCDHVVHVDASTPRFWAHLPAVTRDPFEDLVNGALERRGGTFAFVANVDGSPREWEMRATPHLEAEGAILSIRDVTDRFDLAVKAGQRAEDVRVETLDMVAAQLQDPLVPILHDANGLAMHMEENGDLEGLQRAQRLADNLRIVISRLIDLRDRRE